MKISGLFEIQSKTDLNFGFGWDQFLAGMAAFLLDGMDESFLKKESLNDNEVGDWKSLEMKLVGDIIQLESIEIENIIQDVLLDDGYVFSIFSH